ncbi:hypothetical protein PR003_g24990 [Phytophthora rubi]|uniref:M96 mating-specific protein family n=1 Tax=Phytophthora rubi TaxID=129364 RepID=A0A6A4CJK6_9STRA|nr:hypothetical protein PR003_g24990 [Phytophthora rubi]
MMNSSFQLEDPLALEQALAFADTCDVGSDDEMARDQELDALLADVQAGDLFAPDPSVALMLQPPEAPVAPPLGEFTGLMLGANAPVKSDTSLESALAAQEDEEGARAAKDFAAANAALAAAAAAAKGVPLEETKPTKKRIRRQREELLYLRVKVQEMESSLAELKSKETRNRSPGSQLAVSGKPNSEGSSLLASVWESLANRQYKDRERAEQENRKLKSTLEGQIKLAKCLEKILEEQPEDDSVPGVTRSEQSKLLTMSVSSDPKAVHAQLLSELDAVFDELDAKYDVRKYQEIEKEKLDVRVSSSLDNDIALQFIGFKRVPFPQEVAVRGMWRFTSCEATKRQAYFYEEHETSSKHSVARTFGHKIQSDNGSLDYRSESPIKFSAAPVNGIRFHENGWLVIEKASAKDGSSKGKWSTIASSIELKPIYDDDVLDQDFTVGALTDFVIDSFHRNMHIGEEVVAGIMMEEARKAATQPASSWL